MITSTDVAAADARIGGIVRRTPDRAHRVDADVVTAARLGVMERVVPALALVVAGVLLAWPSAVSAQPADGPAVTAAAPAGPATPASPPVRLAQDAERRDDGTRQPDGQSTDDGDADRSNWVAVALAAGAVAILGFCSAIVVIIRVKSAR